MYLKYLTGSKCLFIYHCKCIDAICNVLYWYIRSMKNRKKKKKKIKVWSTSGDDQKWPFIKRCSFKTSTSIDISPTNFDCSSLFSYTLGRDNFFFCLETENGQLTVDISWIFVSRTLMIIKLIKTIKEKQINLKQLD